MEYSKADTRTEFEKGILTAYVCGEIDHHSSCDIRNTIDTALKATSPDKLVMDLSGVTFMDSSGLGLVMGRYKLTRGAGIDFSLKGVPERPAQMFSMAGLERIIRFEEDNKNEK